VRSFTVTDGQLPLLAGVTNLPMVMNAFHNEDFIFRKFDQPNDKPVAILKGEQSAEAIALTGDGWEGSIAAGHFKAKKGVEAFDLQHITRTPPSIGAKPPKGALVLFDGSNMNAWAKMKEKDWLTEDGPSRWNLISGGVMEVVPHSGSQIRTQSAGDHARDPDRAAIHEAADLYVICQPDLSRTRRLWL